ncbi:poly(A) RNA polymerase GLD2-like [Sinocyclocheilus grahami]|uniref:polynucleotide adenylyltransferase n=1 Tax=Sinocyclocheilus grahami TaxID=75366 RepID=A0A672MV33_SINGR|nr:PREDICTED: poly(A) RNA polymerase GLD2-like [Sinocyclocheilus grahami]XP_016093777.1 PREDICTED: poly(A) RNA polymerase GLD2-like [Sinocyclocheilus grahami]XP_016093778.1 PREDICTED: poly(A) RNA polymerase GLD2-like [Sinocyclocheilus grahami]
MFPRAFVFSHKDGQSEHIFQHILPHTVSQQRRIKAHLNETIFIGPAMTVPRLIPTHQWTPVEQPDVSFSPNRVKGSNRKRRRDHHSQNDLKRQRFVSPGPHKQPARNGNFTSQPAAGPVTSRETCSSNSSIPTCSSATSKPGGCVPSLREGSHQSAFPSSSVNDKLSQQILDLFHACEQQNDDLEKKEHCRAALQRDIQTIFPCAQVFLAGSSLNGFGTRSSDADLCLVIEEGKVNHRTDAVYVLSLVRKLFYTLSYIERPQLIRAKVPILKFRVGGVEFDLNFNNTVGIRNTFLLRTYAYVEKRVRPIILVIKKWASHHCIKDASRGTLSSYSLVLMVLHYLQTLPEPVIPCLQKDYPESFNPKMDVHLVPSGPSNIPAFVSKNQSSLGDLLLGFLKYYATVFKWDKLVISVREAKTLPKTYCREWREKFICVEEPFDRTNTARAVHETVKFEAIKAEFTESYQVLQLRKDLNFILPLKNTRPKR